MVKWKQILGLMAFASLLLFGFQNCGMQFEEDLSSATDDMDTSGLQFNPDGTFSFPLPGENTENGGSSGSGSGGDINLGSEGGVSSSGGGSGGSGGYFEDDPYNPYYQDNHSKKSLYPPLPGNGGVMGNKLYYFTNNGRLDMNNHMDGGLFWKSYTEIIAQWVGQMPGTQEREKFLVVSFKKLSQEATSSTYILNGTSICHQFTATATLPNARQAYAWQEMASGQAGYTTTHSISGYGIAVSGVTIIKKTEEEMTLLESTGCKDGYLTGYDRQGISSFFNLLKSYPILTPSNSSFQLSRTGRWSRDINSALAPF